MTPSKIYTELFCQTTNDWFFLGWIVFAPEVVALRLSSHATIVDAVSTHIDCTTCHLQASKERRSFRDIRHFEEFASLATISLNSETPPIVWPSIDVMEAMNSKILDWLALEINYTVLVWLLKIRDEERKIAIDKRGCGEDLDLHCKAMPPIERLRGPGHDHHEVLDKPTLVYVQISSLKEIVKY